MSEKRRVLAVMGSPRKGGNCDVLVDEVLRGAVEAGATTQKVMLDRCTIGPCHACNACAESGKCYQRDDMDDLIDRMKQADVWVLATPVYWWGPTAQFKLFLDRWYAPWHGEESRKLFKNKRVIVIVTLGDSNPDTAEPTLQMLRRAFAYIGLELADTIVAPGVYAIGDAAARADLMQQAHDTGRAVAS